MHRSDGIRSRLQVLEIEAIVQGKTPEADKDCKLTRQHECSMNYVEL